MEAKTSKTTIPRENSGTSTAHADAGIAWPDPSATTEAETIRARESGLYGMLANSLSMIRGAVVRLSEVIKLGEKGKEKDTDTDMEMEMEMEVKVKMEMETETEMKEYKEMEDHSITATTVTTAAPIGAQIPAPQTAHHISPESLKIEQSSTSPAIIYGKVSSAGKVTKALRGRTLGETPQRSQRRSMRIMESQKKHAQDKLTIASTNQEDTVTSPNRSQITTMNKTRVGMENGKGGLVKAVAKVDSRILKPRDGARVTKKTSVGELGNRIMKKTKSGGGMAKEVGNQSITLAATIDKVTEAPPASALPKVLQTPQRRSVRIFESTRKRGHDRLAVAPTGQGEVPAVAAQVEKVIVDLLGSQITPETKAKAEMEKGNKATIKINSPILKPRAGAGVTKKTPVGSLRSRIEEKKGKPKGEIEKRDQGESITATTTTTITDQVTEPPRSRAPCEVLRGPQRRSMRIMESMQKLATEEGESTRTALVEGKKLAGGGSKRQFAAAVLIDVKSPILKPREGAGVSKRGGRSGEGRRGKTAFA